MCRKMQIYRLIAVAFGVGFIISSFISSVLLRILIGIGVVLIGTIFCREN